jgi:pilus assembly protein CpaC
VCSETLKIRILVVSIGVAWGAASAEAQRVEEREVALAVGEQVVISAQGVDKYSVALGGIVDVRLPDDATQFVVVGQRPGTTTLLLIMTDGREVRYTFKVAAQSRDLTVSARANIRLDLYFVQLSSERSHRIGVAWPGTIGGTGSFSATYDVAARQLTEATASVAAQVLPRLDLAQASGWARIHRQATLIIANGDNGSFSSGGEVNVRVQGALTAGIERITFGTTISVQPRFDRHSGRLEVHIRADVSELAATGDGGLPGRTTSQLDTVVNLELGQSILLAGLVSQTETRDRVGLPVLSQIPVIGALFGSHGRFRADVENVLFIVPTVVEAVPMEERDRVAEALRMFQEFSGARAGLLEVPAMPAQEVRE